MSLHDLQQAITDLIRLPDHNRDSEAVIASFVGRFDLTPKERQQALALANDPHVSKYGRSMRGVRYEKIEKAIPFSRKFIDVETLESIHARLFEPVARDVRFGDLGLRFVEFLLDDETASEALREKAAPFIRDLLRFEREQLDFRLNKLPVVQETEADSIFAHRSFNLFSLNHDIPGFLALFNEGGQQYPVSRHVRLLFVPGSDGFGLRYFEIDEPTEQFIRHEANSATTFPRSTNSRPPDSYSDLVKIGLFRPLPFNS